MAGDWRLSIDFGSAFTAGSVAQDGTITDVLFGGRTLLPSVVALDPAGRVLTGQDAAVRARRHPQSALPMPRREVAAGAKVRLDGVTVLVADLVAAVLVRVRDEAARSRHSSAPSAVTLCHPATWTSAEFGEIAAAAAAAGLPDLSFTAEPLAAARHYLVGCPATECAGDGILDPGGGLLAVCDCGTGTGVAVVQVDRGGRGELVLAGCPVADDDLGGDGLDERLLELLADRAYDLDPDAWHALAGVPGQPPPAGLTELRERVIRAREGLSSWLPADIEVPGYGAAFRIVRREFVAAAQPDFDRLATLIETAAAMAGTTITDLSGLVLAGGTSRTPAISDTLTRRFGVLPALAANPKATVAHGALLGGTGAGVTGRPPVAEPDHLVLDLDDDNWLN